MKLYLDTSALARRYLVERGTPRVLRRLREASALYFSSLGLPEMISLFAFWEEERRISEKGYADLRRELARDMEQTQLVSPDGEILRLAVECVEVQGLKTLEAVHVATARRMRCARFLTANRAQARAARSLGLTVEVV